MEQWLAEHDLILMEGGIVEQLRHVSGVAMHESLVNAPLIYEDTASRALRGLYQSYISVAREAGVPFVMCTPTWRANRTRVEVCNVPNSINADAAAFLRDIRNASENRGMEIRIGGLMSCRNDCYRPEEALSADEAERFHAWQMAELARGGVDFLLATTLPNVDEALGIARAMVQVSVPGIVSFVIGRNGRVLDGTPLPEAIDRIDRAVSRPPLGYMVNCAYPTFLRADEQPNSLFERLVGYQANASSLDHCDLDQAENLETDDIADWSDAMRHLHREYGVKILGGCCGTGVEHLRGLVRA